MNGKHIAIMFGGGFLAMIVGFLALWQFLAPKPPPAVAFDTLKADVASGNVFAIRIDETDYRYNLRGVGERHALGPTPTLEIVTSLAPATVAFEPVGRHKSPTDDTVIVSFTAFVHAAHSGNVKSATIHDRSITYVDGRTYATTGPKATEAEWRAFLAKDDAGAIALTFD